MASESDSWGNAKVIDLQNAGILLVEDGNHGEYRPRKEEFIEDGVAFIRAADMSGGRVLFESAQCINEVALDRIRKGIGAGGDVLLSHKGTVGKVAFVPLNAPAFVCSPQTTFWRTLDNRKLNRRYLAAYLSSSPFKSQLFSRQNETDMAGYVSLTAQRSLNVIIPPPTEQNAIAHILGTLDDKIELNRRMNETLESMARALFKSWFVDFDPVIDNAVAAGNPLPEPLHARAETRRALGSQRKPLPAHIQNLFPDAFHLDSEMGWIPTGWNVGPILKCAALLSGGTPKTSEDAYWNGIIKWASAKDVSQCGNAFLIETERRITQEGLEKSSTKMIPRFSTVIVSRGATTGRLAMFGDDIAMNQTCYALRSNKTDHFFLYCHAREFIDSLVNSAHGSIFDTITTTTFQSTNVLLPPEKTSQQFNDLVENIFETVLGNLRENHTLTKLRDTLLPKLLSGELRIPDAEQLVACSL